MPAVVARIVLSVGGGGLNVGISLKSTVNVKYKPNASLHLLP